MRKDIECRYIASIFFSVALSQERLSSLALTRKAMTCIRQRETKSFFMIWRRKSCCYETSLRPARLARLIGGVALPSWRNQSRLSQRSNSKKGIILFYWYKSTLSERWLVWVRSNCIYFFTNQLSIMKNIWGCMDMLICMMK